MIFGCFHRKLSGVFTPRRRSPMDDPAGSYVICWDCGRQFAYDLSAMRQGGEIRAIDLTDSKHNAPQRWARGLKQIRRKVTLS